jgi:hypothetical protein
VDLQGLTVGSLIGGATKIVIAGFISHKADRPTGHIRGQSVGRSDDSRIAHPACIHADRYRQCWQEILRLIGPPPMLCDPFDPDLDEIV